MHPIKEAVPANGASGWSETRRQSMNKPTAVTGGAFDLPADMRCA